MTSQSKDPAARQLVVARTLDDVRNDSDIRRLSAVLNDILGSNRRCLTCDHFNEKLDECEKYHMRPPSRVIAFGCPEWVEGIPF